MTGSIFWQLRTKMRQRTACTVLLFSSVVVLLATTLVIPVSASGNCVVWDRALGGNGTDSGYAIARAADGGFIVAGYTSSFGGERAYLIKLDADGNVLWDRAFDSRSSAHAVAQAADGGYVLTGDVQYVVPEPFNAMLIKTDAAGNPVWNRTFTEDKAKEYGSDGKAVVRTRDGGYAIAGEFRYGYTGNYDALLIRTDESGNLLWKKCYGGPKMDTAEAILQAADGGFILTGTSYSYGRNNAFYAVRTDADGNMLWYRTYGGFVAYSVARSDDGGYVLAGATRVSENNNDFYLVKIDADGNQLWNRTYGGPRHDEAYGVVPADDGGYVVVGQTGSYGNGSLDILAIKTDREGNEVWSATCGGPEWDDGDDVAGAGNGQYVVVGNINAYADNLTQDVYVAKIDTGSPAPVLQVPSLPSATPKIIYQFNITARPSPAPGSGLLTIAAALICSGIAMGLWKRRTG